MPNSSRGGLLNAGLDRRTFDLQLGQVVIADSAAFNTLYQVTIPAGLLVGRVAEFEIDTIYLQNGGGGVGFTLQIRLGGVVIFEDATANYGSSATPHSITFKGKLYLENQVVNAPRLVGEYWIAGSPATVGDGNLADLAFALSYLFGGTGAINMVTADQLLEVRIAHGAASASISMTRQIARADIIGV